MTEPTPKQIASEMIEYGEAAALELLNGMSDEDCISMVRDFCGLMVDWQANIAIYKDDPVMLGLSCLGAAELFKLAFYRAYVYTDKKVDAMNAINKAFGGEE